MDKSLEDKIRRIANESSKKARENDERTKNENLKNLDSYFERVCNEIVSRAEKGKDCYLLEISGDAPFIGKLCKKLKKQGFKAEYSKGHRSGSVSMCDDLNPSGGCTETSGYDYVNLWVKW